MFTRTTILWSICLSMFSGLAHCQSVAPKDTNILTKAEVLGLLPLGVDMLDGTVVSNYQKLVTAGPRAFASLIEVLNETQDPLLIGRIMAVLSDCSGEKTGAVNAVKDIVHKWRGKDTPDAARVLIYASQTLGRIGRPEDMAALYGILTNRDERVCINVIRTLGAIGDERTATVIDGFITGRIHSVSQRDIATDPSIQEARKAVQTIRERANRIGKKEESH